MKTKKLRHNLSLLTLLAMGNWINTPTPDNDPNAPEAVGNAGEIRLDLDGEKRTVALQSARLSGRTLTFRGEAPGGKSPLSLSFELPASLVESEGIDGKDLRGVSMSLAQASASQLGGDTPATISGGTLHLAQATGAGPWEVDGSVELSTDKGLCSGRFEARVMG